MEEGYPLHKGLVLTVIALCVAGVITAVTSYVFQHINLNSKTREDLRANIVKEDFTFPKRERTVNPEIINIALLGIDSWDNFAGRSDAIIVITLDYKYKTIKLSSFMRDLRVDIHGHGTSKLGHAYSYGGGELLLRTLNDNYGLAIENYIALNFSSFEKIIDLFGGLELDIDNHEKNEINKIVKEPDLENAGIQLLNGRQALAYSRIRVVGRADFERTERQRRVAEELIRKSAALSLTE